MIEGSVVEAVCAEPVIRRLAEQNGGQCAITVCQRHADLYAGHPAVKCAVYDEGEINVRKYETVLRLLPPAGELTLSRWVEAYAEQVKTTLVDSRPNLTLTGYDLIRAQRFGICALKKPKIAVAISPSCWASQEQVWRQFCESFCMQSECSVVVLGQTEMELPAAKNLSGKLTSRETAAVLSQCDILATMQNDYAALAVAVRIPVIVVGGQPMPAEQKEFTGLLRTDVLSAEQVLSVIHQWSNSGK